MHKHVIHFSGGLCSFWAAHRVIQKHGKENVTLLFCDTQMEDEDLYRFLDDAEAELGVPVTRLKEGRTPWELFVHKGMLGNSRYPLCSVMLKREPLDAWRIANADPATSTFYLGMDWTENHRMIGRFATKKGVKVWLPGMIEVFKPYTVTAPMIDEPIWDKRRMQKEWLALGYKLPRLYAMGFPHNNCGGFCVKAGHAHFAHLLKMMPERYAFHETMEDGVRERTGKNFSILTDRRGDGKKKPFTLRRLRERIEAGEDFSREGWGGCGCSVEEGINPITPTAELTATT